MCRISKAILGYAPLPSSHFCQWAGELGPAHPGAGNLGTGWAHRQSSGGCAGPHLGRPLGGDRTGDGRKFVPAENNFLGRAQLACVVPQHFGPFVPDWENGSIGKPATCMDRSQTNRLMKAALLVEEGKQTFGPMPRLARKTVTQQNYQLCTSRH